MLNNFRISILVATAMLVMASAAKALASTLENVNFGSGIVGLLVSVRRRLTPQLLGIIALVLANAPLACATVQQDLTVNLKVGCTPGNCQEDPGVEGSGEVGFADFHAVAPWTFNFTSADAISWWYDQGYFAIFGVGGTFEMIGPDGLTFSGRVTSGDANTSDTSQFVSAYFFGKWSNGLYGYGYAELNANTEWNYLNYAILKTAVAPEPASFLILGSGLVVAAGTLKRKLKRS